MGADLLPTGHYLTSLSSAVVAYGLAGLVLGAHLVFAFLRHRAHARAAIKAAADEAHPPALAPGRAFLCGVVETDDDRPAVVFTLWEEGKEWEHKKSWYYQWKERSRHVDARPFTLRLPGGEAVRVMADEHVALVDTMHTRVFTGLERERSAEILAGEHVCLDGVLLWNRRGQDRSAYRGGSDSGATPFVLRRPQAEPLLIASGGLAAGHRRWAAWYRKAAIALAAVFAVLHLGLFLEHHLLRAAGEIVTGRIISHRTYLSGGRRYARTRHHAIRAELDLPGGKSKQLGAEINGAAYDEVEKALLREVPFLITPRMPSMHQLGVEPRLPWLLAFLGGLLSVAALGGFWSLRRRATPWYEQRRVVERGTGTLAMCVQREESETRTVVRREIP